MKLVDFIVRDAIVENLESVGKEDIIHELVSKLVSAGAIDKNKQKKIAAAILEREALGSTGIGRGIAVPHTKLATTDKVIGTMGRSIDGVDFAAIDGEPVHLVFLLVSPKDQPGSHLEALEHISVVLRDQNFSRFLRNATSTEELMSLLAEADEKLWKGS